MKTAVFFDWDGTLVDSLGLLVDAHNSVRAAFGHPLWSREEFFGSITRSTRELYPILYGERAQEGQDILYKFIKEKHLDYLKVMPGSKEVLDMLQAMNIPMGVVSNKRNDVLVSEVEALGWQDYFGVYIGAGVAEKDKPSAAPLLYAVERHPADIALKGIIYVGDTETDLKTVAEAGCDCAFVQHDGPRPDLVNLYKPLIVCDNMHELKKKLMEYIQR